MSFAEHIGAWPGLVNPGLDRLGLFSLALASRADCTQEKAPAQVVLLRGAIFTVTHPPARPKSPSLRPPTYRIALG
jgi:hypothetical protein